MFCFAALADKLTGTMYTDQTGALPVRYLEGMQYFFIAYDYDTNYIFAKPINNLKDESIIAAFESVFNELKKKGTRLHSKSPSTNARNQSRPSSKRRIANGNL